MASVAHFEQFLCQNWALRADFRRQCPWPPGDPEAREQCAGKPETKEMRREAGGKREMRRGSAGKMKRRILSGYN